MEIKVQICYKDHIKEPFYATCGSAGMDLAADITEDIIIKRQEMALISTGISIKLPSQDYVAYIYARSGLGTKHGICLSNGVGVIDSDYIGEIKVGLINLGPHDYTVKKGERIAQMVFAPIVRADFQRVDRLEETLRGTGGFGSTGK